MAAEQIVKVKDIWDQSYGDTGQQAAIVDVRPQAGIVNIQSQAPLVDVRQAPIVDVQPPKLFDFLIPLLMSRAKSDAMIGDLDERFHEHCRQWGVERARRMYWSEVVGSLRPLLRRAAVRTIKWVIAFDWVRRHFF